MARRSDWYKPILRVLVIYLLNLPLARALSLMNLATRPFFFVFRLSSLGFSLLLAPRASVRRFCVNFLNRRQPLARGAVDSLGLGNTIIDLAFALLRRRRSFLCRNNGRDL